MRGVVGFFDESCVVLYLYGKSRRMGRLTMTESFLRNLDGNHSSF